MLLHTTTIYNDDRYNFLKLVEDYRQYAYDDTKFIPSIGIGINLRTHQDLVLRTFGFDLNQTLTGQAGIDEQIYINDIRAALNNKNITTTAALQNALAVIVTARAGNTIAGYPPSFVRRSSFSFTDEDESKTVFNAVMAGYPGFTGYETVVDNWLNAIDPATGVSIAARQPALLNHDNKERIALVSLAYNQQVSDPLLGKKLAAALRNDDRAEAWYEIRYNSNKNALATTPPTDAPGIANRRYKESDLFALYNDGVVTEADAKSAYRMFTRHKDVILGVDGEVGGAQGYEDRYSPTTAGSSTIQNQLAGATNFLLTSDYTQGVVIAWNHIFVGEDATTRYYRFSEDDPSLTGTDLNDLMFGESGDDWLWGGEGRDVIYGGADTDYLIGGLGDDYVDGGEGEDIYYYYAGHGNDTINDADGVGRLIYIDSSAQPHLLPVGVREATDAPNNTRAPTAPSPSPRAALTCGCASPMAGRSPLRITTPVRVPWDFG